MLNSATTQAGAGDEIFSISGYGQLHAGRGNDILNLSPGTGLAPSGLPEAVHAWGNEGDDVLNMFFQQSDEPGHFYGHHVRGDKEGLFGEQVELGNDVFNFADIENVSGGSVVVGRLDDFDASRDQIQIEGVPLDLNNLPENIRIVEFNGTHDKFERSEDQQWLLITNSSGGKIFYALEGARIDVDDTVPGYANLDAEEAHFVPAGWLPDFDTLPDVQFIDKQNYIPEGYEAREGGLYINDFDGNNGRFHMLPDIGLPTVQENVETPVLGGMGDDLIAAGVNNDVVFASAGDDTVWGGSGYDTLHGGIGNDVLFGGTGDDSLLGGDGDDILHGEYGNDQLEGGEGDDLLFGGEGDDTLVGNVGDDKLYGGAGNDNLLGGYGDDWLFGGDGDDRLIGFDGNDLLWGDDGDDYLNGGAGNDILHGNVGDDELRGGAGDDMLLGGWGSDVLRGEDGDDYLRGWSGWDTLIGGQGNDRLFGEDGNDFLSGGMGDDLLNGGSGNDTLNGDWGNDLLLGGDGADVMRGGGGRDTLDGGLGPDTYRIANSWESPVGEDNRDVFKGFESGTDKIDLQEIDANWGERGDQAFEFSGTLAAENSIWYENNDGFLLVRGDMNGDGEPDFEFEVWGAEELVLDDFIF